MKNLSLILLLLVFLSCNKTVSKSISTSVKNDVQIMLLAGQSNMAGAGNFDALSDDMISRIEKAGKTVSLSIDGKSPQPIAPIYSEYQKTKRGFGNVFGPEIFLGLTLAEKHPDQKFLLIKKSRGGTALYGAWNPEWTAEKAAAVEKKGVKRDLQLYSEHIQQIKAQIANLKNEGKSYEIAGVFWMQGENDAAKEIAARSYEVNLKKLIASYRSEFNVQDLPFIMGQINSSYGRFPLGPEMVRTAMVNVAKGDENVGLIRTSMDRSWSDFPKHDDNVHYNHVGQMRLGIAFAEHWEAIKN